MSKEKKGSTAKNITLGCLGMFGIFVIIIIIAVIFSDDTPTSKTVQKTVQKPKVQLTQEQKDSLAIIKQAKARTSKIEQLQKELKSIDEGVDFSSYRGNVTSIQIELALFGVWNNFIKEGEISNDSEIKKLASQLKSKVVNIQTKEFPALRKEYTRIVANKLWENDIEVYSNGTGSRYINFTGGIFAANKNKQDFQNEFTEILSMLRFKQARYQWYKGQAEYTYYTIYEGRDSDLVN